MKYKMKNLWEKIKKWWKKTAGPWILRSWLQIINVIIILSAYKTLDDLGSKKSVLVGFWGFILLAYWIFWKLFGGDKVVMPMLIKLWHKIFGIKNSDKD